MNMVIEKPLISEKSMKLAKIGLYTFIVGKKARKEEIKKAIEEKFEVEVEDVKTANFKDLKKLQKKVRATFILRGFKKAIVKLKKGQKITLFEADAAKVEKAEEEPKIKEKKNLLKGTKVKIEEEVKTQNSKVEKKGK